MSNIDPSGTARLIDPDLRAFFEAMPRSDLADIPAAREAVLTQFPPSAEMLAASRLIPGCAGDPDVEVFVFNVGQAGEKRPAVLHIHGGGMVLGSALMASLTVPAIIEAIDAVTVSVEYRLAPETPFPGPQEDCYAALAWLFDQADDLGIDRERVLIMGESAGGGLAAAVALMARDRGEYRLAGQVLVVPMLDCRTGTDEDPWGNPVTGEFVWTRDANRIGWAALQGSYAIDDERKGWFSPSLADDLSGLPATYIATGALDLFLDENLDYARRLIASGVAVDLDLYAGAPHGFQFMAQAEVAKRADTDLRSSLRRMVAVSDANRPVADTVPSDTKA